MINKYILNSSVRPNSLGISDLVEGIGVGDTTASQLDLNGDDLIDINDLVIMVNKELIVNGSKTITINQILDLIG